MDFNTFANELSNFVKNKEIDNKSDFINLALFKFLKESNLNEHMTVISGKDKTGKTCIFQLQKTSVMSTFHLRDFNEQDNKSFSPIKKVGNFVLEVSNTNEQSDTFLDNNKKERLIKAYNQIIHAQTLDDLSDSFSKEEDVYPLKDYNVNQLSRFLDEYEIVKEQIKKQEYNQRSLTNIFSTLLTTYTKFNAGNFLQVGHAADKFLGEVVFNRHKNIPTKFLIDGNVSNAIGINKHVEMTQDKIDNLSFDDTLIGTISKAIKNNTGSTLIEDIYNQHIKPHYIQHFSLSLRLLEKQSTIEDKLNNPLIKQFINQINQKYPAAFSDNSLHSFKSTIYQSSLKQDDDTYPTLDKINLFDVLNKFNMVDEESIAKSTSIYNDIAYLKSNKLFSLNRNPDEIRFVGETEMAVKYIISGEVKNISIVNNNSINALEIYSMILLNKPSIYNEMAIEQVFKYCKDNNLALINRVEVDQYQSLSAGSRSNHTVFAEIAEAYKDHVYVINAYLQNTRLQLLKNTTLDLKKFMKNSDFIYEECLKSYRHLDKLKELEMTMQTQNFKNKI